MKVGKSRLQALFACDIGTIVCYAPETLFNSFGNLCPEVQCSCQLLRSTEDEDDIPQPRARRRDNKAKILIEMLCNLHVSSYLTCRANSRFDMSVSSINIDTHIALSEKRFINCVHYTTLHYATLNCTTLQL